MKKLKFNFAILALVLGLVFAFGTAETKSQSFSTLYGYDGNSWEPLTGDLGGLDPGDYSCISGGTWCKGNFDTAPVNEMDEPIDDDFRSEGTVVIVQ